jgi:hypothetical protein
MAKPKVRNYWVYFCFNSITPLLYYLAHIFPELDLAGGIKILAALLIGLFLTGIFITWLSTSLLLPTS